MSRGAFRGAAAAWLGLAALDALLSTGGADSVTGVFGFLNSVAQRALSPDFAAIPDFTTRGPTAPGTDINPAATGQASPDDSSGHNYDLPVSVPKTPTTTIPVTPAPAVHAAR